MPPKKPKIPMNKTPDQEETKDEPTVGRNDTGGPVGKKFREMNKLQLEPVGAFGFNSENLPNGAILLLKTLKDKDSIVKVLTYPESVILLDEEMREKAKRFKSIQPFEKRMLSLTFIKRNMLALVRNATTALQRDSVPNVLMAYSVGRRSLIANTHQKSNLQSEEEVEALNKDLETRLSRGEFLDPNASKCTVVQFLEQNAPIQRVTAISSAACSDKKQSVLAIAEMDYKNPCNAYVSFFDMTGSDETDLSQEEFRLVNDRRMKVSFKEFDTTGEIKRFKILLGHENNNPTVNKDATLSPKNKEKRTESNMSKAHGNDFIPSVAHPETSAIQCFISQIEFSHDLSTCALLLNGGENGILVYDWNTHKEKPLPYASHHFKSASLNSYLPGPTDFEEAALKKFNTEAVCMPPNCTELRFNPMPPHKDRISLSGPNGFLAQATIRQGAIEIKEFNLCLLTDTKMDPETQQITFTGHAWDKNFLNLLVACTLEGHLLVLKPESDDEVECIMCIVPEKGATGPKFVAVQTCQLGFVAATENGWLHFYEYEEHTDKSKNKNSPDYQPKFRCVREWRCSQVMKQTKSFNNSQCANEKLQLTNIDILDGCTKQVILSATFNNRSIYTLNLWDQVYSSDKKEDLLIKQRDHNKLVEENRKNQEDNPRTGSALTNDAAFFESEEERILDLKYQLHGSLGFHSSKVTHMDVCLQRPIILTASDDDQTVRIWNYVTNTCELVKDFSSLFMNRVALHASGYYMAVAFDDNLRVFHILYQELEEFHIYQIRHIKQLKFSSGGQYLLAATAKHIHVISTYEMEEVGRLPPPSQHTSHLSFNERDSCVSAVSSDGFMQRYLLPGLKKLGESPIIVRGCHFTSSLFLSNQDEYTVMCVGQEKESGGCIRIYDKDDLALQSQFLQDNTNQMAYTEDENPHKTRPLFVRCDSKSLGINDICEIEQPGNDLKCLAASTNRGTVQLLGMPPDNLDPAKVHQTVHSHWGQVDHIESSHDGQYVFSAGSDGAIFVYKVTTTFEKKQKLSQHQLGRQKTRASAASPTKKTETSPPGSPRKLGKESQNASRAATEDGSKQPLLTDQSSDQEDQTYVAKQEQVLSKNQLGRVILVTKEQMQEWQKQQRTLQMEMQAEAEKVNVSVRSKQIAFDDKVVNMEREQSNLLNQLTQQYKELQTEESEQKEVSKQNMQKMDKDHEVLREELVTLYEKKLDYEKAQYGDLKFLKKRTQKEYEDEINQLHKQHEKAIETLLDEFKKELHTVQEMYEKSKRTTDGLKMINEEKLMQQERDQTKEFKKLSKKQNNDRENLQNVLTELKNDIVTQECKLKRFDGEEKRYKEMKESQEKETLKLQKQLKEKSEKIAELDEEKKNVKKNLKQKEIALYRKKFTIDELQKTKHVLSHRTQEMKASLEPKEQQIESLKEQLIDFQHVWEVQKRALKQMEKKVEQKKEKLAEKDRQTRQGVKRIKELNKEISAFTDDIKKLMQANNEREYVIGLALIYQNHAKKHTAEILEKKKKDPELIEEIDRKAKFLEEMRSELSKKTKANMKANKDLIKERTDENRKLIDELNEVRKQQTSNMAEINKIDKDIQDTNLKRTQIENAAQTADQLAKSPTRNRQVTQNDHNASERLFRPKSGYQSGQLLSENGDEEEDEKQFKRTQSRGKLIRGPMFNAKPAGLYKHTIQNLLKQLHETNQHVFVRKLELASLQEEFKNTIRELGSSMDPAQVAQLERMFAANTQEQSPGQQQMEGDMEDQN